MGHVMDTTQQNKKNIEFYIFAVLVFLASFLGWMHNVNVYFFALLIVWLSSVYYGVKDYEKHPLLLMFLFAFYTLLMGREFLYQYGEMDVSKFTDSQISGACIEETISLLAVVASYWIFTWVQTLVDSEGPPKEIMTDKKRDSLHTVSKHLLYLFAIGAIGYEILYSRYVRSVGYAGSYIGDFYHRNAAIYLLKKCEDMLSAGFLVYLATMPDKKETKIPFSLYLIYLVLSLGTGHRSEFVLGLFLFAFYYIFREKVDGKNTWIKKKTRILCVVCVPLLLGFFYLYNYYRFGSDVNLTEMNMKTGLKGFFFDQGVTGDLIKYSRQYYETLRSDMLYTFTFARDGFIAKLFDIPIYVGNSVDKALHSGMYSHAISYQVLGQWYLNGRGTGSSYIAELFQDFGYTGIVFGSLIYGYILMKIDNAEKSKSVLSRTLKFVMIPSILWAPRGLYSGFISSIISPNTVIPLVFIYLCDRLYRVLILPIIRMDTEHDDL